MNSASGIQHRAGGPGRGSAVAAAQQGQPPTGDYQFGRERWQQSGPVPPSGVPAPQPGSLDQAAAAPHDVGEIPPPPPGFRRAWTLAVLYPLTGFVLLMTGASISVLIDYGNEGDTGQIYTALFMAAGFGAATIGLGGWIIRIHRRRAVYRRILDDFYAKHFGYHPDST